MKCYRFHGILTLKMESWQYFHISQKLLPTSREASVQGCTFLGGQSEGLGGLGAEDTPRLPTGESEKPSAWVPG